MNDYGVRKKIRICVILGCITLVLFVFWKVLDIFTVRNVYVEGNKHYTSDEIRRMVEKGWFGDNTLVLSLRYADKSITGIPFIQTMDVDVVDRDSIRVNVYEKALAGYVEYLGSYMYFDKDGIIVENSEKTSYGIPEVTGLKFDHLVMYEPLPVEDPSVFKNILSVTQLLEKYGIMANRIYFDKSGDMTMTFGQVRVNLGDGTLLEEKLQHLQGILQKEELQGKKGELDMSRFSTGKESTTFVEDPKD